MIYTTQVWKRNNHNNSYDVDYITSEGRTAFDLYKRRLWAGSVPASEIETLKSISPVSLALFPDYSVQLLSQANEDSDYEVVEHLYTDTDVF